MISQVFVVYHECGCKKLEMMRDDARTCITCDFDSRIRHKATLFLIAHLSFQITRLCSYLAPLSQVLVHAHSALIALENAIKQQPSIQHASSSPRLTKMATSQLLALVKGDQDNDTGTGSGFGRVVLILTGVSALMACLLTILYVAPSSRK